MAAPKYDLESVVILGIMAAGYLNAAVTPCPEATA
jgi:hypothetical protein